MRLHGRVLGGTKVAVARSAAVMTPPPGCLRRGASVRAVLGEERLLEARLAADEVEQLVAGRGLDHRRDRAADAQPERVVLDADVATRRAAPRTRAAGTVSANRSSTWWWARSRRASTRSTLTSWPSRMIATRSQVRSTSDRMWLDRKTDRPSACASRTSS